MENSNDKFLKSQSELAGDVHAKVASISYLIGKLSIFLTEAVDVSEALKDEYDDINFSKLICLISEANKIRKEVVKIIYLS